MITPIEALACGIVFLCTGGPVALAAACAKKTGHAYRNPQLAVRLIETRPSLAIAAPVDRPIALIAIATMDDRQPIAAPQREPSTETEDMSIEAEFTDYATMILPEQEAKYSAWIALARESAIVIAREKGNVSSDDIWDRCPPPPSADPRVMAAAFHPRKDWEYVGSIKSRRRINHGRRVTVWSLKSGCSAHAA